MAFYDSSHLSLESHREMVSTVRTDYYEAERKIKELRFTWELELYLIPNKEPVLVTLSKARVYRNNMPKILAQLDRLHVKYGHLLELKTRGIKGWFFDYWYILQIRKFAKDAESLLSNVVDFKEITYSKKPSRKLIEIKILLTMVALIGARQYILILKEKRE